MKYNFSGYATKHNVKCSDGRTIMPDAFAHQDGAAIPLVWQHKHDDSKNVLGHAVLEHREDGVYAYGVFNDTESGKRAKELVKHGDVNSLSIYANQLEQDGNHVEHGNIKEVSLVIAGANPEAYIDNVVLEHSDGSREELEDQAIIYTDELLHADDEGELVPLGKGKPTLEEMMHGGSDDDKTVSEIFNTLSEVQKKVVYYMIGTALEDKGAQHNDGGDLESMKQNVFSAEETQQTKLSHEEVRNIMHAASKMGSLEQAVLKHAGTYGIDNIDVLFPDAQLVNKNPDLLKRRTEWVSKVLNATKKSPFSKIKSMYADITADEARAKGYVTGAEKFEEVFPLFSRETTPTTIYKKQKLDRDDILDITDLDVVAFLKAEMRIMLDEEIARAVLVGDGRLNASPDKVKEANIRPVWLDDALYSHKHGKLASDATIATLIDEVVRARINYKGSGQPTFYAGPTLITEMLLSKDADGHRIYKTLTELAAALRVKEIVEVEIMDGLERNDGVDDLLLQGIMVNLSDYTLGANKGGNVSMFDDFDIDFNQYKYLIETRLCGALTKVKSAVVIEKIKPAG